MQLSNCAPTNPCRGHFFHISLRVFLPLSPCSEGKRVSFLSPSSEAGSSLPQAAPCMGGWAGKSFRICLWWKRVKTNGLRGLATRELLGFFASSFPAVCEGACMGWALVVGTGFDMTGRQPNREAHLENLFLNLVLIHSLRPAAEFFPSALPVFSACFLESGTRLCYCALLTSFQFCWKLCSALGSFSAPGSQVPSDCWHRCFPWPLGKKKI